MAIREWDKRHFETTNFHHATRASVLIAPEGENWQVSLIPDNGTVVRYSVRRDLLGEVINTLTHNFTPSTTMGSMVIGWNLAASGSTTPGHPGGGGGPHGIPTIDAANIRMHFDVFSVGELANRVVDG